MTISTTLAGFSTAADGKTNPATARTAATQRAMLTSDRSISPQRHEGRTKGHRGKEESHLFVAVVRPSCLCGELRGLLLASVLHAGIAPRAARLRAGHRGCVMYEQILPWVGLAGLLILCLPFPVVQKVV